LVEFSFFILLYFISEQGDALNKIPKGHHPIAQKDLAELWKHLKVFKQDKSPSCQVCVG
jgi:hypothetical protein